MAPSECPSNRGKPGSAICFPPVAHAVDADNANRIRNFVDDSVVADPNAPVIDGACELAAADGPGVIGEGSDRSCRAEPNPGSEAFQILLGGSFNYDLIHGYFFAKSASTASSGR